MTRPTTGFVFLDDAPRVVAMAHRGGAKVPANAGIENTVTAFEHAWSLGYRYFETDVHATGDGVLVAFHDDVLDRVTTGSGAIYQQPYAVVSKARVGGIHAIPRFDELLERFPHARFNVDIKTRGAIEPLAWTLEGMDAYDRVCVGSFDEGIIRRFRRVVARPVATSCGPVAVALTRAGLPPLGPARDPGVVLQVPHRHRGLVVVTRSFVERAHADGRHVHVWTVDDPAEMEQLLDLGVDGIISDRTDVLAGVLRARGLW